MGRAEILRQPRATTAGECHDCLGTFNGQCLAIALAEPVCSNRFAGITVHTAAACLVPGYDELNTKVVKYRLGATQCLGIQHIREAAVK